jgi:hypothetical protein
MPKRKIEAEVVVDVTGADKVEKLEKSVEALSDTEIAVGLDTSTAETSLQRFERELDELNLDSARELRIEFRAQVLEQNIRNSLRLLDRLEDPIQIRTETANLEATQSELRELSELAGRKYQVEVEVDPRRNAARAADDVERLRQRGEGLQSALPALRGFTDELGRSAQAGGIAGQALGDLGDFSLILGEKFGLSETKTAALGTALGAAGLATIIASVALPAIKNLIDSQDDLAEATGRGTDAIGEQTGAVEALEQAIENATTRDPLVTAILGQFEGDEVEEKIDKIGDAIVRLGGTIDGDLGSILRQASTETGLTDLLRGTGEVADLTDEKLRQLVDTLRSSNGYDDFIRDIQYLATEGDTSLQRFVASNEDLLRAIQTIEDATGSLDIGKAYRDALNDIRQTEQGIELLRQAQANLEQNATPELLIAEYERLRSELEGTAEEVVEVGRVVQDGVGNWNDWETAAREALGAVLQGATEAVLALDPVGQKLREITGRIDEEQTILGLADQFDRVAEASAEWAEAVDKNSADAGEKMRAYRREQLKLTEDVVDYLSTLEDVPVSKITRIDTLLDKGNLVEAQRLIEELTSDKFASLFVDIIPRTAPGGFESISFGISGGSAPVQGATNYGAGTFLSAPVTIINPPGTPAATSSSVELHALRNGDRSGAW